MKRIIQLVPGLPPMLNGVGDFSLAVARALRDRFAVTTHFVVCSPDWNGRGEVDGLPAIPLPSRDPRALACLLGELSQREGAQAALLQLSPYGFASNGVPSWLASGLDAWKRGSGGRRLITYFHEMFAGGAPWRKSFWLSPWQRHAAARIARSSDRVLTNRVESARWLAQAAQLAHPSIGVLPVLSGIGEPERRPSSRAPHLVVWSGAVPKATLYRQYGDLLGALVSRLGIECVLDIGSTAPDTPRAIEAAPVRALGIASVASIRELLAASTIGVVAYPPSLLGKSSIFAAFCAYALPALVIDASDAPRNLPDGLVRGTHLLTREDAAGVSTASLASIGEAARDWYAGHDAQAHAAMIAEAMASLDSGAAG